MSNHNYLKTVDLLLEVLPYATKDQRLALKGGTAINLFHRDFSRLSVDIDLCYLALEDRKSTFINLHKILKEMKKSLEKKLNVDVRSNHPLDGKKEAKLIVRKNGIEVKIEPNFTLRGCLFESEMIELSPKAQNIFHKSIEINCLSFADTFGGKICAALDRQHPRDFYDVKILLDREGITRDIKDSFIFYLISHSRPIDEILSPHFKDIEKMYNNEFVLMTEEEVPLSDLIETRLNLVYELHKAFSEKDKSFIKSFVENNPDWNLIRDPKVKEFPSVQWKLVNQDKMDDTKRKQYVQNVLKALK